MSVQKLGLNNSIHRFIHFLKNITHIKINIVRIIIESNTTHVFKAKGRVHEQSRIRLDSNIYCAFKNNNNNVSIKIVKLQVFYIVVP